jgi:hypothetical protein
MAENLEQAILDKDWNDILNELFSDEEVEYDDSYYEACINENLEEAKRLIALGYQADNTWLWANKRHNCVCGLSECHDGFSDEPIFTLLAKLFDVKPDIKLVTKLVDYGLLSIEDIPDRIIFKLLHRKYETTQEIIDWIIKVIPPSRLVTYRESEDDDFFVVNQKVLGQECITVLYAILWSHMPYEKVEEYLKTLLSSPEMRELAYHKYDGVTILRHIILQTRIPVLETLLSMGGFDVNEKSIYDGNTAFQRLLECEAKSKSKKEWKKIEEVFALLSRHGMDLYSKDQDGNSLSNYIVHYGWEPILGKYLVSDEVPTIVNYNEHVYNVNWYEYRKVITRQQRDILMKMVEIVEPYKYCKDEKIVDSVILELLKVYDPGVKPYFYIIRNGMNGFQWSDDLERLFTYEETE